MEQKKGRNIYYKIEFRLFIRIKENEVFRYSHEWEFIFLVINYGAAGAPSSDSTAADRPLFSG
jgi:hypothetical protein